MRFLPVLLLLLGLASCGGGAGVADSGPINYLTRQQRVRSDVAAMMQGMDHARAQSEAFARAKAQ